MKLHHLMTLCAIVAIGSAQPAFARKAVRAAAPAVVHAPDVANATATFSATNIAVGVGYSWGHGILTYKGHSYPFKVKGLSALGIGASTIDGTAEVFHLKSLEDFNGVYGAAGIGGAIGTYGAGTGALSNGNGVEMRLNTRSEGLELTLAISGVTIELEPR